jgi:hypothetical protein
MPLASTRMSPNLAFFATSTVGPLALSAAWLDAGCFVAAVELPDEPHAASASAPANATAMGRTDLFMTVRLSLRTRVVAGVAEVYERRRAKDRVPGATRARKAARRT